MGTPLTGSTVASTYTGLLKTADNATLTGVLRTLSDGSGNDSALQVSTTALNSTGDFSVATSRFTVASASGNTAVAGTLNVTGVTSLSSLTTSGNATIGGTLGITGGLTIPGTLSVTGASTLTGAVGMGSTLNVTGASTLASLGVTGAATIGTTLGVTGATTLGTVGATTANLSTLNVSGLTTVAELDNLGNSNVGGTLDVTGATTLGGLTVAGNLVANGNTTIGNAGADLLTINANVVTLPNVTSETVDLTNDKVLITDASDSSKVKVVPASQLGITASNAPQCAQTIFQGVSSYTAVSTGSGTEITDLTASITPRSTGSKILVTIVINYSSNQPFRGVFRLTRNGTEIGSNSNGTSLNGIAPVYQANTGFEGITNTVIQFYDTSPSAGSNTYKINIFSAGVGSIFTTVYLNRNLDDVNSGPNNFDRARTSSSMILQEYFA